jgi:hypothetical protein
LPVRAFHIDAQRTSPKTGRCTDRSEQNNSGQAAARDARKRAVPKAM